MDVRTEPVVIRGALRPATEKNVQHYITRKIKMEPCAHIHYILMVPKPVEPCAHVAHIYTFMLLLS